MKNVAYQASKSRTLPYKGLRFVQQEANAIDQYEASLAKQKAPPTLYTFFGGDLLTAAQVKYRVDKMVEANEHKYTVPFFK